MKTPICVVVNAYSTGKYLAKELMARGFACVHVQSEPEIPESYLKSFNASDFLCNITHHGDLKRTLTQLSDYDVAHVIVGSELGVELADGLSESLNLLTNGTDLTRARRDKFEMMEALRAKGISTAEYLRAFDASEIIRWVAANGFEKIVMKPVNSAGSDNVHICQSKADIHSAFDRISNKINQLGLANRGVFVQEFLQGVEYIVNSVSRDKNHYIAEIWRCEKRQMRIGKGYTNIYDVEKLLPYHGEDQAKLIDYTLNVLNALEISHGPAHAEVMLTSRGPLLIEIGSRLMGGVEPSAFEACLETHTIRLTADAYTDPSSFLRNCRRPYQLKKFIYTVILISTVEGSVTRIPLIQQIERLESFFSISMNVCEGTTIEKTVDLFSSPGLVYLVHSDRNILERDYQMIRQLEPHGYVVQASEHVLA